MTVSSLGTLGVRQGHTHKSFPQCIASPQEPELRIKLGPWNWIHHTNCGRKKLLQKRKKEGEVVANIVVGLGITLSHNSPGQYPSRVSTDFIQFLITCFLSVLIFIRSWFSSSHYEVLPMPSVVSQLSKFLVVHDHLLFPAWPLFGLPYCLKTGILLNFK